MLVRGWKSLLDRAASPPRLRISYRYLALSDDTDAPAAPSRPDLNPSPSWHCSLPTTGVRVARCSPGKPNQRTSSQATTSSSRRKILKEAALRRSGGLSGPEPAENPSLWSDATALPQHSSPRSHSVDPGHALSCHEKPTATISSSSLYPYNFNSRGFHNQAHAFLQYNHPLLPWSHTSSHLG